MIPTRAQAFLLWDKFSLPESKKTHVLLVERVALFLAGRVTKARGVSINTSLLSASALLHDIDKAIPKAKDEHHPDTGVRVLKEEGFSEVADVIRTHSLSSILDQNISPKTWEEKLLYLADKMVKYEILDVDRRFDLWRAEKLPKEAVDELERAYPKVKSLEHDICELVGVASQEIAALA